MTTVSSSSSKSKVKKEEKVNTDDIDEKKVTKKSKGNSDLLTISTKNYPYKPWGEYFEDYQVDLMPLLTNLSWKPMFKKLCKKECFTKAEKALTTILKKTEGHIDIFPYPELIFTAFNLLNYENVKVVIIGQDPYFNFKEADDNMIPEAMGLCFSVPTGIPIPSSLRSIFKNLLEFKHVKKLPESGNLAYWAIQGCLMLNASLTVQAGFPNEHAQYWNQLTDEIIAELSNSFDHLVFVLWGKFARDKLDLIDQKKHKCVISSHPSGQSVGNTLGLYPDDKSEYKNEGHYPAFKNQDHFKLINEYLEEFGSEPINWKL